MALLRGLSRAKVTFQQRTLHTIFTEGKDMTEIKSSRAINFSKRFTEKQEVEGLEIRRARAALDKRENDLIAECEKDPQIIVAKKLVSYPNSVRITTDLIRSFSVNMSVTETVTMPDTKPSSTAPALLHSMDPRTVNLLLNGPILSPAEKRKLVAGMVPALDAIMQKNEEKT